MKKSLLTLVLFIIFINTVIIATATIKNPTPNKPLTPWGPSEDLKVGQEGYIYTTSTTNPSGNPVTYMFDWGDDSPKEWSLPMEPGNDFTAEHIWTKKGTFEITVTARDYYTGAESVPSDPLEVHVTRPKSVSFESTTFDVLEQSTPVQGQQNNQ